MVGVLLLVGTWPASKLVGVAAVVVGILLPVGFLDLPREIAQYTWIVNLIAGIALIDWGIQKLMRG